MAPRRVPQLMIRSPAVLLAAAMSGCASLPPAAQAPLTAEQVQGEWRLVRSGGRAVTNVMHLQFQPGGRLDGRLNCNSLGGDWRIEHGQLRFADVITTTGGCLVNGRPAPLHRAEDIYRSETVSWMEDGQLIFQNGSRRLVFRRAGS